MSDANSRASSASRAPATEGQQGAAPGIDVARTRAWIKFAPGALLRLTPFENAMANNMEIIIDEINGLKVMLGQIEGMRVAKVEGDNQHEDDDIEDEVSTASGAARGRGTRRGRVSNRRSSTSRASTGRSASVSSRASARAAAIGSGPGDRYYAFEVLEEDRSLFEALANAEDEIYPVFDGSADWKPLTTVTKNLEPFTASFIASHREELTAIELTHGEHQGNVFELLNKLNESSRQKIYQALSRRKKPPKKTARQSVDIDDLNVVAEASQEASQELPVMSGGLDAVTRDSGKKVATMNSDGATIVRGSSQIPRHSSDEPSSPVRRPAKRARRSQTPFVPDPDSEHTSEQ